MHWHVVLTRRGLQRKGNGQRVGSAVKTDAIDGPTLTTSPIKNEGVFLLRQALSALEIFLHNDGSLCRMNP